MELYTHDPHSKKRLSPGAKVNFPEETLFHRIARVVCEAECLPRKELYESWEVAKRVFRLFKGGRIVDLACGHGLLAYMLLLLDPNAQGAVAVDLRIPESASKLASALEKRWPRLEGQLRFVQSSLQEVPLLPGDRIVSVHACGALTDLVIERAIEADARVAVLPCCHPKKRLDLGGLEGWMRPDLAADAVRAGRLNAAGFRVKTQLIPEEITPYNRLLMGTPRPIAAR